MTIHFPGPAAVMATHGDTLREWQLPEILSSANALAQIQNVRQWASEFATARAVIETVEASQNTVSLVCMKGGATVFEAGPSDSLEAVAYWNVDAKYFIEDQEHFRGGQPFHPYVALLHELGHAVQWIKTPAFFKGLGHYSTDSAGNIRDAARERALKQENARRATAGSPAMNYRQKRDFADAALGLDRPGSTSRVWSPRIEIDNMVRHEWPICREAGLPLRLNYGSMQVQGS